MIGCEFLRLTARLLVMSSIREKARAINDGYRTAAMNRQYYACRLTTTQRLVTTLDVVAAVAASGTIAAWASWQTGAGATLWKALAGFAAVVTTVKPFLRLSKDVERYSELVIGYAAVYFDLKQLVEDVRTEQSLSEASWSRYQAVRQRTKDLGIKDDLVPKKRLHRRCYEQVKKEIPQDTLWWPSEERT